MTRSSALPVVGIAAIFKNETPYIIEWLCIDPAVSAQVKLLKHMPRQGFSFSALGEGADSFKVNQ